MTRVCPTRRAYRSRWTCADGRTCDTSPFNCGRAGDIYRGCRWFRYQIAEVYALRNDATATFEWLDRAWSNRDPGIQYLLFDPFILRYKDDLRFASFCRKVGLPMPGEAGRST
jgi:hypothetical protein